MSNKQDFRNHENIGNSKLSLVTGLSVQFVLCVVFIIAVKYLRVKEATAASPAHLWESYFVQSPTESFKPIAGLFFLFSLLCVVKILPRRNIADKFIMLIYLYLSVIPIVSLIAKGNHGTFVTWSFLFLAIFCLVNYIVDQNTR